MTKLRIGIFGGSFDPPHIGHLILAAECAEQLHLHKVLWLVTGNPPHKQDRILIDPEIRAEMVRLSIQENSQFELSRVEMDRPGPHYASDSINFLRVQYPQDKLIYLVGEDSLESLPTWHNPRELIHDIDELGIMSRKNIETDLNKLDNQIPGIRSKAKFIQTPEIDISSTEIRKRVRHGQMYRYFLHPDVNNFIKANGIYQKS